MAKAIAIIADVNAHDPNPTKLRITLAVAGKPDVGDTFESFKTETLVLVDATENAQQLNAAVLAKVKEDALTKFGVTLIDADITTTKFT